MRFRENTGPGSSQSLSKQRQRKLKAAQIRLLYAHSGIGSTGALLGAILLGSALWKVVSHDRIIAWALMCTGLCLAKYYLIYSFHGVEGDDKAVIGWAKRHTLTVFMGGLLWGVAGVWLFPSDSISHQFWLCIFIVVVGAAGSVMYAPTRDYIAVVLPTLLPLSGRFIYEWDGLHVTIGLVILLLALVSVMAGGRAHRVYTDTLMLRFDNEGLVKDLQREVSQRDRLEAELKRAHDDLEIRVEERTAELNAANRMLELEITERKRAEEALKEGEERYRSLFNRSLDAVYIHDFEGNFLDANDAALSLLGYDREAIPRLNFASLLAPGQMPKAMETLNEIRSTGRQSDPIEFRLVCKSGETKFVETSAALIYREGRPVAIHGIARDISGRKRSEEAQRRLVTAIEQAAEGVIITDANGTIEYVNPAFETISGYSRQEVIGQKPSIWKSGQHDRAFYETLWRTLKLGNAWAGRFVNKRRDGKLYHEDSTISPVRDRSGKIVNFVAVKRDISQEVQLQQQLQQAQKMEAIGTLTGGIAHDFNNLLQVILGYSELVLIDENLSVSVRNNVTKIDQAARNGADLIQRLRAFGRKDESNAQPLNLNHHIRQVHELLSRTIPRMISLELVLAEDLATIRANPTQIEQILMNLAVNAKDAMPDGGKLMFETENVVLDEGYVRPHLELAPGNYVLLTVTDTGTGMDNGTMERIFEPFFTTKGPSEGTGLGLAVVYGIVREHGGRILCHSEPGEGATFEVYFPSSVSPSLSEETVQSLVPLAGRSSKVVDDVS